jgi:hypothetical protein
MMCVCFVVVEIQCVSVRFSFFVFLLLLLLLLLFVCFVAVEKYNEKISVNQSDKNRPRGRFTLSH